MILRSFDHVGWLTWLKTADWKLDIDFCRNVFDMVTESFWDSAPHVNVREGKNKKRNSPFTFLKCCRNIFSVDLIIILWSHVQWVASSTVAVGIHKCSDDADVNTEPALVSSLVSYIYVSLMGFQGVLHSCGCSEKCDVTLKLLSKLDPESGSNVTTVSPNKGADIKNREQHSWPDVHNNDCDGSWPDTRAPARHQLLSWGQMEKSYFFFLNMEICPLLSNFILK